MSWDQEPFTKRLWEKLARLVESSGRVERALEQERNAHEATKQRLWDAEADAEDAFTAKQTTGLNADPDAGSAALESLRTDAAEDSAGLAQLISQTDDRNARLAARLRKAQADLDAAGDNCRSQIAIVRSRLHDQDNLRKTQADLDAARDDFRSQIAILESRLRDQDTEIAQLKSELAALQARPESPETTLRSEVESEAAPDSVVEAIGWWPTDDLTKIKGIGPVLKEKLHGLGITSFQQIAAFTRTDIDRVNEELDFPGRIERDQWVEQAKAIVQDRSID